MYVYTSQLVELTHTDEVYRKVIYRVTPPQQVFRTKLVRLVPDRHVIVSVGGKEYEVHRSLCGANPSLSVPAFPPYRTEPYTLRNLGTNWAVPGPNTVSEDFDYYADYARRALEKRAKYPSHIVAAVEANSLSMAEACALLNTTPKHLWVEGVFGAYWMLVNGNGDCIFPKVQFDHPDVVAQLKFAQKSDNWHDIYKCVETRSDLVLHGV